MFHNHLVKNYAALLIFYLYVLILNLNEVVLVNLIKIKYINLYILFD